jgi:hypothetical protein
MASDLHHNSSSNSSNSSSSTNPRAKHQLVRFPLIPARHTHFVFPAPSQPSLIDLWDLNVLNSNPGAGSSASGSIAVSHTTPPAQVTLLLFNILFSVLIHRISCVHM